MTSQQLNRAVAYITGESLCEIRRRGFSLADPESVDFDPEPSEVPPQVIDWDKYYGTSAPRRFHRRRAVAV